MEGAEGRAVAARFLMASFRPSPHVKVGLLAGPIFTKAGSLSLGPLK